MHLASVLSPFCLGLLDFDTRFLTAVLIPLAGIFLAGVITVSAMYFHHREKQLLHDTARLALEKGQALSPALIETLSRPPHAQGRTGPRNDIRSGLILVAVGAGLYLFFSYMYMGAFRFLGAIPGLIGAALLLYGLLEPMFSRRGRRDIHGPQP